MPQIFMNHTSSATSSINKKIAIFYPNFGGGGAESVCLWMLEALKAKYDLTLFTFSDIDIHKLNSMYATQLDPKEIKVRALFPKSLGGFTEFLRANSPQMRMLFFHLLIRFIKKYCHEYDLVISAYNATDLGKWGIQYIHWTGVIDETNKIYKKVSSFSDEKMKSNISICNSDFVAQRLKQMYDMDSQVIYPPVVTEFPEIPWEEKENAFICSGRLTKAKQPHQVIEIVRQVRERGFDVKLYLTGGGGGVYAWGYQRFLRKKIEENSAWVTLYQNLSFQDYVKVLAKCKYGIHFKQEPFGISIAEMLKAGAIPFVKDKGGQIEIVGAENQDLFFKNRPEAVERIVALLSNSERLQAVRGVLEERKSIFSTTRFMTEIDRAVQEFFEKQT